jgi:DNA-binding NtrC family response regulator
MNEKNNFALVPISPSAIEKVEPGAKRILSGMVADTLALARKKPRRVVIVDDEEGPRECLRIIISEWCRDATVLLFDDAEEAWEELMRGDPDLLITDDMMPKMNGLELLRRLADKKAPYPIFAAFGYYEEQRVREFANRGLNVTFFSKPFDLRPVWRELEKYFGPSNQPSPNPPKDEA